MIAFCMNRGNRRNRPDLGHQYVKRCSERLAKTDYTLLNGSDDVPTRSSPRLHHYVWAQGAKRV